MEFLCIFHPASETYFLDSDSAYASQWGTQLFLCMSRWPRPPLVTQNTGNLPIPPSRAHTPWWGVWFCGIVGWGGSPAETWWASTLGLGMGHRLSRRMPRNLYGHSHVKIWNTFKKALWHFVQFDWLCEMTLSGSVSVPRNPQMMPLILKTFPVWHHHSAAHICNSFSF